MIRKLLQGGLQRVRACARRVGLTIRFLGRAVTVHPTSWISLRSTIRVNGGGAIFIGKNCEIHPYSMLLTYGGNIQIGDNCSVNPFSIVYGHGGVRIGNGVRIAAHTVIIPANHNPRSDAVPLYLSGTTGKGIVIEDDVWLGAGSCVLDGAHISRNAIVGAGSVVTKSVPENVTVAGVPARIIRRPAHKV
jgi:acetyltransferase-like isoleucine patch superfamily enzyme